MTAMRTTMKPTQTSAKGSAENRLRYPHFANRSSWAQLLYRSPFPLAKEQKNMRYHTLRKVALSAIVSLATVGLLSGCSDPDDPETLVNPTFDNPNASAPDCNGERVWDGGPSQLGAGYQVLASEGDTSRLSAPSRVSPCTVVWEYNASLNCSIIFTWELWVEQVVEGTIAPGFSTTIQNGNLVVDFANGNAPIVAPPSGISRNQLANAPDCMLSRTRSALDARRL